MGSTGRAIPAASTSATFRSATESIAREMDERTIDRKSFTAEGGGQWTLDLNGIGGIQILDETNSSRGGFGMGKAYGITVWDGEYNSQPQEIIYGSLNDAKRRAKEKLKSLLNR